MNQLFLTEISQRLRTTERTRGSDLIVATLKVFLLRMMSRTRQAQNKYFIRNHLQHGFLVFEKGTLSDISPCGKLFGQPGLYVYV